MVVRVVGRTARRYPPTHLVDAVAATVAQGRAVFDTSQRSRRNALAASIELSSAAAERRRVEEFLADYASVRNSSQSRSTREAS